MIRYYSILFVVNTLIGILLFYKGGKTGIQPKLFFYIAGISLGLGIAFPFLLGFMGFYQVVMIFIVLISAVAFKIASKEVNLPGDLPDLQYDSPAADELPVTAEPEIVVEEDDITIDDDVEEITALPDAEENVAQTETELPVSDDSQAGTDTEEDFSLTWNMGEDATAEEPLQALEIGLEPEDLKEDAVEYIDDFADLEEDEIGLKEDGFEFTAETLESIEEFEQDTVPIELTAEEEMLPQEEYTDKLPDITDFMGVEEEALEAPIPDEEPADEVLTALGDESGNIITEQCMEEPIEVALEEEVIEEPLEEETIEESIAELPLLDIIADIPLESPVSLPGVASLTEGLDLIDETENAEEISFIEASVEEAAVALLDIDIEEFEPLTETATVAEELSDIDFTDSSLEAVIDKGFAAKFEGHHEQAIQLFRAALNLQPDVDLVQLLVLDISGMYIETGNYQQAWICMENLLQDYEGYINNDLRKEIFSQMKYLEILQNLLQKSGFPQLPLADVPDLIKFTAEEKTRRWKEEVFSPKHSF